MRNPWVVACVALLIVGVVVSIAYFGRDAPQTVPPVMSPETCIKAGLIFEWTDTGPVIGETQLCGKEIHWTKAYGPNMEYTINLLQAENKALKDALEIIEGWPKEEVGKILKEATANIQYKK